MAFTRKADCKEVVASLQHAGTLSAEVRSMLSSGLALAVKAPPAARHSYQEDVIAMARDALLGEQSGANETKADIARRVAAAEADFEACRARLEQTSAARDQASAEAQGKAVAATQSAAEASKFEYDHAQCCSEQDEVAAKVAAARQKRDSAEAISECPLKMLLSGSCEDEESTQEAIQAVVSFLTEIHADAVLIAGAPAALKNKPTGRQGFDEVIVAGISEAIAARRSQLEASSSALDQEFALVQSETLGLWAIADVARDAATAAAAESQVAEVARKKAIEARKEADKQYTAQQHTVNMMLSEQAKHDAQLGKLASALEAVARLKSQEAYVVEMAAEVPGTDVKLAEDVDMAEDVEMADASAAVADLAAEAPRVAMVA